MKNHSLMASPSRTLDGIKYLYVVLLAILFIVQFYLSLQWRVKGDSVYLFYLAYLINDHGFVPYKDFFEINMPGTYLFYIVIGKLFGYSDLVLRLVNVAWLASLLVVTWLIIRPFGKLSAFASCILFGLIYLGYGPYMSLERDAVGVLPIAVAILLAAKRKPSHSLALIHFIHGTLFAIAALIKPQLAIGLPAIIAYNCITDADRSQPISSLIKPCVAGVLFTTLGFLLTLLVPFLWLWKIGALSSFVEISSSYLPLYAQIPGNIEFQGTYLDLMYVLNKFTQFEGLGILLTTSMFAVYLVVTKSNAVALKRLSVLLFSLSILYALYVVIGGKLWYYHWMPYMYFSSLGTAIILFSPSRRLLKTQRLLKAIPLFVFIMASMPVLHLEHSALTQTVNKPATPGPDEREDQITAYLKEHLSPTDKIQPLSWAGGALEAMMEVKAIPATPYIVELQFYHHISNSYIQKLRQDFMSIMAKEMPKFIIDVRSHIQMMGMDGPNPFPELKQFIEQSYYKDYVGKNFEIFRRIDVDQVAYEFGTPIMFNDSEEIEPFLGDGWASPEASHIWTTGERSTMRLSTPAPVCNPQMELLVNPFYFAEKTAAQRLTVVVNNHLIGSTTMTQKNSPQFAIPREAWTKKSPVTIEFVHPDFTSPRSIGLNNDPRELAFAFKRMTIKDCQND